VPPIAHSAAGQSAAPGGLQIHVSPQRIGYGRKILVSGSAPASDSGQPIELEYLPSGSSSWQGVASSTIGGNGRFQVGAPLQQSGSVKVTVSSGGAGASGTSVGYRSTTTSPAASSPTQHISVAAALRVRRRTIGVVGGQPVEVRGKLLPGIAGRTVRLQARGGGGWRTVASAHTTARGNFRLRYATSGSARQQLRVRFAGDGMNGWANAHAGELNAYRQALASWYDDGGSTACGFHAYHGVANKELPCGTKVAFRYGGRTVVAVVDDRGPYAGGREWDLNQNTAAALGFSGVGAVWSSS
jgi:hypothetical protein